MRGCFISIMIFLLILIIAVVIFFKYEGSNNLYYIEEANMYIKTFPLDDNYTNIAFSDKKINKFSDTLDYIKVCKGTNYGTTVHLDPNNKNMIYFSGNGLIKEEIHLKKYARWKGIYRIDTLRIKYDKEEIPTIDTMYLEHREEEVKYPYIGIYFDLYGFIQKVSLKNSNDTIYMEIKPIK